MYTVYNTTYLNANLKDKKNKCKSIKKCYKIYDSDVMCIVDRIEKPLQLIKVRTPSFFYKT